MKTDLISRSELFNKLATVPIKAESVETTTEIFKIINSMQTESVDIAESVVEQICDKYCKFPGIVESDNELDRICDNCPLDNIASARTEPQPDLISRADAIDALNKLDSEATEYVVNEREEVHGFCTAVGVCVGAIALLPSAEQVTGKLQNPCDSLLTGDKDECKEQKSKLDLISRQIAIDGVIKSCFGESNVVIAEAKAINYIKKIPSASVEVGEWIPCSKRLPKEKARVLTYDTMGDIVFGQYDKGRWYWEAEACADYWAKNDGVIAWMPLPEPYMEEGEKE